MERISTSRKFRILMPKKIARLRDHVVCANFYVINDIQHDFRYAHTPPAEKSFLLRLEIFNFAMLFFFLPNFN